jgi:hypothetical protein
VCHVDAAPYAVLLVPLVGCVAAFGEDGAAAAELCCFCPIGFDLGQPHAGECDVGECDVGAVGTLAAGCGVEEGAGELVGCIRRSIRRSAR